MFIISLFKLLKKSLLASYPGTIILLFTLFIPNYGHTQSCEKVFLGETIITFQENRGNLGAVPEAIPALRQYSTFLATDIQPTLQQLHLISKKASMLPADRQVIMDIANLYKETSNLISRSLQTQTITQRDLLIVGLNISKLVTLIGEGGCLKVEGASIAGSYETTYKNFQITADISDTYFHQKLLDTPVMPVIFVESGEQSLSEIILGRAGGGYAYINVALTNKSRINGKVYDGLLFDGSRANSIVYFFHEIAHLETAIKNGYRHPELMTESRYRNNTYFDEASNVLKRIAEESTTPEVKIAAKWILTFELFENGRSWEEAKLHIRSPTASSSKYRYSSLSFTDRIPLAEKVAGFKFDHTDQNNEQFVKAITQNLENATQLLQQIFDKTNDSHRPQ